MNAQALSAKAENIRSVLRYMDRFKNTAGVIYLDGRVIDSPLFAGVIRDIHLLHQTGMQVVVVPGARERIDKILTESGIAWRTERGVRITEEGAMPLIKMAAFDVSNRVMTSLAGERCTAVIGNWVRARGRGIIEGVDYGTAGEIDRISADSVRAVLASGFIPIFPCIGWSAGGKPYNISSVRLATEIAAELQTQKLFFVALDAEVNRKRFAVPPSVGTEGERVPVLSVEEAEVLIGQNRGAAEGEQEVLELLDAGREACRRGVERAHILNGSLDGALPCEVFSDFGSGTMLHKSGYGGIRNMTLDDVPAVLGVMLPFTERGILLSRTQASIAAEYRNYIVFELDGQIRACAALHSYDGAQCEIAAVAVDESFSHMGTGPKLVAFLVDRARQRKARSVFVLTTQTADWFEQLGFMPADIGTLPEKRRAEWTPARGSRAYRLTL